MKLVMALSSSEVRNKNFYAFICWSAFSPLHIGPHGDLKSPGLELIFFLRALLCWQLLLVPDTFESKDRATFVSKVLGSPFKSVLLLKQTAQHIVK